MFDIEQTVITPLGSIPVRVTLDQALGEKFGVWGSFNS